jgi:CRP-like cAMP-binding protein
MEITNPKLVRLKHLAETNSDNPKFLEDYATALLQDGKIILARKILHKLYRRLHMSGRVDEAQALKSAHGEWVTGEEGNVRPAWGGHFLPLEGEVKHSFLGRKRKRKIFEGEVLFRTGDVADKAYLVTDGELAISLRSDLIGPILVNLAYRGDIVGESILTDGSVRTADVFANKDSTLIEFDKAQLEAAFSVHSELHELLLEEASLRRKVILLSKCTPFSLLTLSERIIVAEQASEKEIPAGTVIKQEHGHLSHAALVVSGEIESYFTAYRERQYAGSLYTNSLFGLSKLYLDEVIPYELVAKTKVRILAIPHGVFEDASLTYSKFEACATDIARASYAQTMDTIRILSADALAI